MSRGGRAWLVLAVVLTACGPEELAADGGDESGTEDSDESGSETTGIVVEDKQGEIDKIFPDLDMIVAGTVAYFEVAHPIGDEDDTPAPHHCPYPVSSPAGGQASITPSLATNCNDNQTFPGLCAPGRGGPGHYPPSLWDHNSVWSRVGFAKTEPHAFHYNLIVVNHPDEYGACSFTAQAFGDLDNDAIYSTYERRAYIDEDGLELEALLIDKPCE